MADVDVLLPIRKPHVDWLRSTLESIAHQQEVHLRLVAVLHPDDAALAYLLDGFPFPVQTVTPPAHGNLSDALNVGLASCTAPYVARIDQDDIAAPDRLVRQCAELEEDPSCAVVGSNATLIDRNSVEIGHRELPSSPIEILRMMRWKSAIMHPSATFRTDLIWGLSGYSTEAANVEDYELWLRVLQYARIRSLPDRLLKYRVHSLQMSQTRAITPRASSAVLASRVALARARHESVAAARFRHKAWALRQAHRRWSR